MGNAAALLIVTQTLAFGVAARTDQPAHAGNHDDPNGNVTPGNCSYRYKGIRLLLPRVWCLAPVATAAGTVTPVFSSGRSSPGKSTSTTRTVRTDRWARQVYTEDDQVHAIANTGAVDADLFVAFLREARRIAPH